MKVTVARVGETLYEGEAYSLTVPGLAGVMTILGHHMPLVSTLKKGTVLVRETKDAEPKEFTIEGGIVEVSSDTATVLL
jgi:F-type H+-transporting ATPase subunit epsilon